MKKIFQIGPEFRWLFEHFSPTLVDRIIFMNWRGQLVLAVLIVLIIGLIGVV